LDTVIAVLQGWRRGDMGGGVGVERNDSLSGGGSGGGGVGPVLLRE